MISVCFVRMLTAQPAWKTFLIFIHPVVPDVLKESAVKLKPHIPRIKFRYGKGRAAHQTPIEQQASRRPVSSSSGKIQKSQEVVKREGPPRPYYRKKLTEEEIESINSGGAPTESKVDKTKPKSGGDKKKPVKK